MSSSKEDEWNKAHASTKNDNNIPSRLYTDENPATTIKGTGFKNERIARRTIELTSQPGVRYKQYWTIRAMRERAFHHPNKSKGMLDAIKVFDEWLENYQEVTSEEKQMYKQEWETFRRLCQSTANKDSYGKEPTKMELKRARDDLLDGQRLLIELLTCRKKKMSSKLFPLTSFVAIFGGPGIHGYGSHSIDSEEVVSKIIINGMDGIEELIGATKASKLMIDNVTKVEVTYNRVDELSMAITIIRSKQSNTLENLWEKASADSCRSNQSSGSKKRQRDDNDHTKEEGIKLSEEWTCNACTFIHIGISKRDFLACALCGSTRTECSDNI